MAKFLTAPNLTEAGIAHAFFTRAGGVSRGLYESLNGGVGSNDERAHVNDNRARMAQALGVAPEKFITPYQVHSPDVAVATQSWGGDRPRADAVVTATSGLAIGVTTADCGPVLFADPQARVIGAAHAGWRGAVGGVLEATIAAMENLGAQRERIVAALGPMISQANYEVGEDMRSQVPDAADRGAFFKPASRADHFMFDLPGYVAARLQRAGLTQISDLRRCTYGEPETFYSFRRTTHRGEADYGRHVNAIVLPD